MQLTDAIIKLACSFPSQAVLPANHDNSQTDQHLEHSAIGSNMAPTKHDYKEHTLAD